MPYDITDVMMDIIGIKNAIVEIQQKIFPDRFEEKKKVKR